VSVDLPLTEAEVFRRSHCERPEASHQCIGEVSIKPGILMLDCKLCGQSFEQLAASMGVLDCAQVVCRVLGVRWHDILPAQQRQILLELHRLLSRNPHETRSS
jgi:hypothetical protein